MSNEPMVALSKIGAQVGEGPDAEVVWFDEGEEVKGDGVTDERMEQWKANGTVGPAPSALPSVQAEKDALEARVAELEEQLKAAKEQQESGQKPVTSVSPSSSVPAQPGTEPGSKAPAAKSAGPSQSSNK